MSACLVIGHRGAPMIAPENTLASFEHAVRWGVDMIEFDVRLTRDCVPVIAHDRSIESILKKRQYIDRIDLNTLRQLEREALLQNRCKVSHFPLLIEVVESFIGLVELNIELKPDPHREKMLVKEVLSSVPRTQDSRVIYSSFSRSILMDLRGKRASARLGVLFSSRPHLHMKFARTINAYSLHPSEKLCKIGFIEKAHAAGFRVMPWTVNSKSRMRQLLQHGVDGIFTDQPKCLISLAKQRLS